MNLTSKRFKVYVALCSGIVTVLFFIWTKSKNDYTPIIESINSIGLNLKTNPKLKYILVWTSPTRDPIKYLGNGRETFLNKNCPVTNCYVSSNRKYFDKITDFDVIVFHGPDIEVADLPKTRSHHQKYVFASMESAHYYPLSNKVFNNYFNWTWTYKLNSDENYGYISIWDKNDVIIGPKEEMHWKKISEMDPIDDAIKTKLSTKKHAAAWFVSNCKTPSKRENLANELMEELKKHNLTLDIYGHCGTKHCPRSDENKCLDMIKSDYYFYLSFENSLAEDYVTEKLLRALKNYAVPIVYGGANYTRFMPDGIYLDASKSSVSQLAEKIAEIIKDKEIYHSFFKWHNHYSYHDTFESCQSNAYCRLCSLINDQQRFEQKNVYTNIIQWWSPPGRC